MGRSAMKRNLPPLPWLRAFEASARHLSFTHAASELNLTQAAISKQIKLLEQHVREPLFHRRPRSLTLTKIGEAYLPKVHDAFERLAAGTDEVFGARSAEALTVRSAVSFSVNWLGRRLPRFFAQHPGKRVRIVSSVWNDAFDKDRFDLDILYGTGQWAGLRADRLTWESVTPVCSPALPDGATPLRKPEDLQHHKLLHVLGYEAGWAVWLQAAGVEDFNPGQGLQFDTSLLAFEVAARGEGVALGRTSLIQGELASGRLVDPFNLPVPVDEAFYLGSPRDGTEHPDANLFRTWLLQEADACRQPASRRSG